MHLKIIYFYEEPNFAKCDLKPPFCFTVQKSLYKSWFLMIFSKIVDFYQILMSSFISYVSSFYIKICILLYYFDQECLRYKPSKIHQNHGLAKNCFL